VSQLELEERAGTVRLRVRVKPRASKDRVVGVRDGMLEVAVAAPPVDGEANLALCSFLAKTLGLPRSAVQVVSGETARFKLLSLSGLDAARVRQAFEAAS
jgi:uncharacterized protein (TIGR00251 family)